MAEEDYPRFIILPKKEDKTAVDFQPFSELDMVPDLGENEPGKSEQQPAVLNIEDKQEVNRWLI